MSLNLQLDLEELAAEASAHYAAKAGELMFSLGKSIHDAPIPFLDGPAAESGLQLPRAPRSFKDVEDVNFI